MVSFLRKLFSKSPKKNGLHSSETRQFALEFARYFGTWREGSLSSDPVKVGRWILNVMEDVNDPSVRVLRAVAENVVACAGWPPVPTGSRFEEIAQGIFVVCRHLSTHGLPAGV